MELAVLLRLLDNNWILTSRARLRKPLVTIPTPRTFGEGFAAFYWHSSAAFWRSAAVDYWNLPGHSGDLAHIHLQGHWGGVHPVTSRFSRTDNENWQADYCRRSDSLDLTWRLPTLYQVLYDPTPNRKRELNDDAVVHACNTQIFPDFRNIRGS